MMSFRSFRKSSLIMLKYLFLSLIMMLFACTPPQARDDLASEVGEEGETADEAQPAAEPSDEGKQVYAGHFEYVLTGCEGKDGELREGQGHQDFMRIKIGENNEVELLRPSFLPDLSVAVRGFLAEEDKKLSNASGSFGIADEEDWSDVIGKVLVSDEGISGQLSNVKISHKQTSCFVNLEFSGELVPSGAV